MTMPVPRASSTHSRWKPFTVSVFQPAWPCARRYSSTLKWTTIEPADTAPTASSARQRFRHNRSLNVVSTVAGQDHKGLRRYYETGSTRGIQANHAKRLRMQLAALDTAVEMADLDIPGYGLHPLKGNRKGIWAITVSGNWRLTFEFSDGNAYLLDYEDYH